MRRILLCLALTGIATAQKCFTCTQTAAVFEQQDSKENCWFIDNVDSTATADNTLSTVDCIAATDYCVVMVKTIDGYPVEITRGCSSAIPTNVIPSQLLTVDPHVAVPMKCYANVKTDSTSTTFTAGTSSVPGWWTANEDTTDLTEVTCAETCDPVAAPCNGRNKWSVSYMDNCDDKCKPGSGGTCNYFTGQCEWTCQTVYPSSLGTPGKYLRYPGPKTANGQEYECREYQCTINTCVANQECTGPGVESTDFQKEGTCSEQTTVPTPATPAPPVVVVLKKCLQCTTDSGSDTSCASGTTTATDCVAEDMRCAAVSTMWIDAGGKSIREVIERGCTNDAIAYDTCEFSGLDTTNLASASTAVNMADFSKVTVATCRYVDETNTAIPDGNDARVTNTLTCREGTVCESLEECKNFQTRSQIDAFTGFTTKTGCNNCKVHNQYYEHMRDDGTYERSLVFYEEKCRTVEDALVSTCTSTALTTEFLASSVGSLPNVLGDVRSNINWVHCFTYCQDKDECHQDFWPGQPLCYTCAETSDTTSDCFRNLGTASRCDNYWDNTCWVKQSGLDLRSNWATNSNSDYMANQVFGAPAKISRGCSYAPFGTTGILASSDTATATRDAANNQNLWKDRQYNCQTSGCNFGPALPSN